MSDRWYYQMLLEEFGPVTTQQLEQLIDEGTLSADDLVRPEESTKWITVASRESYLASNDAGPAEIEDLSELSFSFEQSGTPHERTVASGSKSSASETRAADRQAPVFFELPEVETDVYYCQSLGQTLGPMPLTELVALAESGSLSDSDLVRFGETGAWQPANEISELSATFMLMDHETPATTAFQATAKTSSDSETVAEAQRPRVSENVSAATPHRSADPVPTQSSASTQSESPASRKKVRRKKAKKEEDEVLEEIFDDVFVKQEDEKPSRLSPPIQPTSVTSAAATSAPLDRVEAMKPATPVAASVPPAYSSMSSSAAVTAAMARPTVPHQRSSVSFSFDGTVRTITIGILLVAVVAGLIWQFGMPSFVFGSPGAAQHAGRMQVAVVNYKALGEKPSEGKWQDYCQATRSEFLPKYKAMVESGASGAKDSACMEGMKAIIAMTSTKAGDVERRKELLEKIEKHIAAMQ